MNGKIKYHFTAKMWRSTEPGSWHFISIPKDISKEIRKNLQWQEEGWGRMKAAAEVNALQWETAIWFDTKSDTYLLPVKAEIRKKAKLHANENTYVTLWV